MSLGAATIYDVRTGGSDTNNGGAFDPGATTMATDGAATVATGNSPVFTSATYSFVAGDVGAWIYISSGTNWLPGFYQIASVAGGAATLSAAIGQAYNAIAKLPVNQNTVAGCASTASPTAATWTIDYSQQNSAQFTYTDLTTAGTGSAVTSASHPFGKQQVGNVIVITGGTNFNVGRYVINSVSGVTATVAGTSANLTTGAGASGTGGLGGCLATPGQAGATYLAANTVFVKSGTYTLANATANTAGGPVSFTANGSDTTTGWFVGWNSNRSVSNTDTSWPDMNAGAQSTLTLFNISSLNCRIRNWLFDGNSATAITGFVLSGSSSKADHIMAQNCTAIGLDLASGLNGHYYCSATNCSGTAAIRVGNSAASGLYYSEAYGNSVVGILVGSGSDLNFCISSGNTGQGFGSISASSSAGLVNNCVSYGNTSDGFDATGTTSSSGGTYINCIAEANGGYAWKVATVRGRLTIFNCAVYNNTSGNYVANDVYDVANLISQSAGSYFVNPGSGNFAINNIAGQGSLLRSVAFPATFPRGTTSNYMDVGAARHQDPAGGDETSSSQVINTTIW